MGITLGFKKSAGDLRIRYNYHVDINKSSCLGEAKPG